MFAVATTSTPVPATSAIITSPILTGSCTVAWCIAKSVSSIFAFGIAVRVYTGSGFRMPATRTSPVTMRVGFDTSDFAYASPLGHECPATVTSPPSTATSISHPLGQLMHIIFIVVSR